MGKMSRSNFTHFLLDTDADSILVYMSEEFQQKFHPFQYSLVVNPIHLFDHE
jgi:hypothetical protein